MPQTKLRGEFNDNRRMTTGPHESIFGMQVEAGGSFDYDSEVLDLNLTPLGRFVRYTGADDLDSETGSVDASGLRKFERWAMGLGTNFTRDTTLVTELDTTGQIAANKYVNSASVQPYVSYIISEIDSLRLQYGYTDVSYEDAQGTGFRDYTYASASATWSHVFSEKNQATASVYYNDYDVPDDQSPSQTDTYGLQATWKHKFSSTLDATVGAGVLVSKADFVALALAGNQFVLLPQDSSDNGYTVMADVIKKFERGNLSVNFSRNVYPSSRGAQVIRTDLKAEYYYRFTPYFAGAVGGRYINAESQRPDQATISDLNRDYYQVYARLGYRISPHWEATGAYYFSDQKFSQATSSANANSVHLILQYNGDSLTLLR
ncbi:MAG: hypothetical protein AB7Q97_10885 [Gammaproteobacteria bacterium]